MTLKRIHFGRIVSLLLVTIFFVPITSSISKSDFHRIVLKETDGYTYHLAFVIVKRGKRSKIVIENGQLHYFLSSNKLVSSSEEYEHIMLPVIRENKELNLDEINGRKLKGTFQYVVKDRSIDSTFELGRNVFIQEYCPEGYLKLKLNEAQKSLIIYYLFQLNIGVIQDCETGVLLTHDEVELLKRVR